MFGRIRWARWLLVSCAWMAAASTILTVLVVVSDLDVNAVEHDAGVVAAEKLDALNSAVGLRQLFHRYPYKPLERKPQGQEDDSDISYNDNVWDKNNVVVGNSFEEELEHVRAGATKNGGATNELILEDKIFWSERLEKLLPKGLTDAGLNDFKTKIGHGARVKTMKAAKWNLCGRPKNQFIILEDNSTACARYRHPQNNLVYGELLSFHLSRLLGLDSVPAVSLSRLDSESVQWQGQNLSAADWQEGHTVALIQWVDELNLARSRVYMPAVLLASYESDPLSYGSRALYNTTTDELTAVVQWTDLIIFDYIIGHYDRVASMQDGAEQESNPLIMHESMRNLRQTWPIGKLWLLDNECGLLDAYTLLYGQSSGSTGDRFVVYHQRLLQSICVFRRQTVDRVRLLAGKTRPDHFLQNVVENADPLFLHLEKIPDFQLFKKFFRVRLKEILKWVDYCNTL